MGTGKQSQNFAEDVSSATLGLFEYVYRLLSTQLSFGVPVDVDTTGTEVGQRVGNMRGAWVELSLTAATGTVTVTHNLDIPITTLTGAGSTANRLNVRWFVVGAEFGSRTGAVAQPAAPAAFTVDFLHMLSSAVTTTSLVLNYSTTGFVPTATTPLFVSLFVVPAVR